MHIILYPLLVDFLQDVGEAEDSAGLTQTFSVPRTRGPLWPMSGGPKKWEQVRIAKPEYVQACREKGSPQRAEVSLAIGVSVASVFIDGMNKYMHIPQSALILKKCSIAYLKTINV